MSKTDYLGISEGNESNNKTKSSSMFQIDPTSNKCLEQQQQLNYTIQQFNTDEDEKKKLKEKMNEITESLENELSIKVILPPTEEENSRCKGKAPVLCYHCCTNS